MIIEKVILREFGGHRELIADMDASTVGIFGPNGSGKSTLLKAIKFAFSAELDDKAESFVRAAIGEDAPSNGEVEVFFRKTGVRGEIMRRVGKSPKRRLKWNGETITKAAEIEQMISTILGADRLALTNAIFLPQGELDKLLFGSQAEREQLFMKLMLLGHFNGVSSAVEQQIQRLNSMLQDNSAVMDEVRGQIQAGRQQATSLTQLLNNTPDASVYLAAYRTAETALKAYRDAFNAEQTVKANSQRGQEAVTAAINAVANVFGLPSTQHSTAAEWIEAGAQALSRDNEDLLATQSRLSEQLQERNRRTTVAEAKARSTDLRQRAINGMQAVLTAQTELAELPTDIDDRLKKRRAYDDYVIALDKAQTEAARVAMVASAANGDLAKNPARQERLTKIAEELTPIVRDVAIMQTRLDVLAEISKPGHVVGDHCPLCSHAVDASVIAASAAADKEKLVELRASQFRLEQEQQALRTALQQAVNAATAAESAVATAQAALAALKASPVPASADSVTELEQKRSRRQQLEFTIREAERNNAQIQSDIVQAESRVTAADWEWLTTAPALEEYDKAIAGKQATIDILTGRIKSRQDPVNLLRKALSNASAITTQIEAANANVLATTRRWDETVAAVLALEPQATLNEANYIDNRIATLEAHQTARQQLAGQVAEAERSVAALLTRLAALERAAATQEKTRELLDQMKNLKRTFDRHGLPATYLNYRFGQLTELTQRNLGVLESSFTVFPDPTTPMSFLFQRMDDPTVAALEQGKLSGGQRVRLTIAFLLSVQQLIIPEVGLLVLDEPSSHLDNEAVDSLRELFLNMATVLANAESQVIVCDHHATLASAFGKVVTLRGPSATAE